MDESLLPPCYQRLTQIQQSLSLRCVLAGSVFLSQPVVFILVIFRRGILQIDDDAGFADCLGAFGGLQCLSSQPAFIRPAIIYADGR